MAEPTVLIANRGEVAVRVARAAAELGLRSCAVYSGDDADSPHVTAADSAVALPGRGPAAYLDPAAVVEAGLGAAATLVHPGYGFLAESPELARRCSEAGLTFVGPPAEVLERLGDKVEARRLAAAAGVPVAPATDGPVTLEEAQHFLAARGGPVVIKAVAGGGGRGMRVVAAPAELEEAFARCASEAEAAFGRGDLYVEALVAGARHIEVQVLADAAGEVSHLWERDCSVQRRHQKLIEVGPAPALAEGVRRRLLDHAMGLARAAGYLGLGTFEFLVAGEGSVFFIEANPRLQVEHTVTEEVTGVDLVAVQLRLALGATLAELGLRHDEVPAPRGSAVQARVNLERVDADGTVRPTGGLISRFEPPAGPGIRVDTFARSGYRTNPAFDPLIAKVVAHSPAGVVGAARRADRALAELRTDGVATNVALLRAVLAHPEFGTGAVDTNFFDGHRTELLKTAARLEPAAAAKGDPGLGATPAAGADGRPSHGASAADPSRPHSRLPVPPGTVAVGAPLQGTVISLSVTPGDLVHSESPVAVLEAMKMEHVVRAGVDGVVRRVEAEPGATLLEGEPLLYVEPGEVEAGAGEEEDEADLDHVRDDLAAVLARQAAATTDEARPEAVERRRRTGQRTARENVADLCDPDSFVEYGSLVIAAQRARRSVDELIARTPADGLVAGVGRVNGDLFGPERSSCAVLSYDYTVLAGTQGQQNHRKKDRLFELVERLRLPVVFFTEGGGGRPGDTDAAGVSGLDCMAFALFGELSGLVPLVGVNSGRCFAGNAALLGCCDVIIATANSNIGMGGPAMIEGGGLGVYRPEDVGPMDVQVANGVVDVAVADEAEAVAVAKRYLSYFQGPVKDWDCADQRRLRSLVPENRKRVYDVRRVLHTMADTDSVLELRAGFGAGIITALIRVEGMPLGVVANNPTHLGGAIDSDGADKAARFMQLCDAFDLPLLFLCDTPGFMVGPEAERTAQVRHFARMFVVGASLTVPFFTIVLRKGYGLGAQAMAGGSFKAPLFTISWPTGEFGGMGLEGAVRLGYRRELDAIEDPAEQQAAFERMVARSYEHGRALNVATYFEIDDVIDPAESRRRIAHAIRSAPPPPPRQGRKRPCVDTW
ncbi:MAG TPA: carboxyl transferase domain-containing protein [Acidimicrobiales bacterium]|nr:carboxyl transferase domain-containing protein [Acidimicrobiales bacterium]